MKDTIAIEPCKLQEFHFKIQLSPATTAFFMRREEAETFLARLLEDETTPKTGGNHE